MKHLTPPEFHTHPVYIELVGAGATGSLIMSGLVRLHLAMLELGHPYGLKVRCWDFDTVSHSNIGRQLFTNEEINRNKAVCLISRYNYHYGLEWLAEPRRFADSSNYRQGCTVIISAVDSRKSRSEINDCLHNYHSAYLIDCGCGRDFGQLCCGNGSPELPYPWQKHPEMIDTAKDGVRRSSCSMADSLQRQGLFINQWIATGVLEMLWQLFRKGGLNYSELYFNLANGNMRPVMIPDQSSKNEKK